MLDRHRDDADVGGKLAAAEVKLAHVKNRNAAEGATDQVGIDVEAGHDVQSELLETRVLDQSSAERSDPYDQGVVAAAESEKVLEFSFKRRHFIAYARLSLNVQKR